ncbi:aldehyde dehydrogenase family protein [Amycolatopsis sp. NPDC059090]|uniref:aldehyde dehydrogenase family protein n=1 Tax=unclassified Amycolatopsis TaxID=2618356 RepID=UPI00366CE259
MRRRSRTAANSRATAGTNSCASAGQAPEHPGYRLAGGIWTTDLARSHTMDAELKAGTIWINSSNVLDPPCRSAVSGRSPAARPPGFLCLANQETSSPCRR